MQRLREELDCAIRSNAKVLISGESGVGKEVVCEHIHRLSRCSRGSLVAINCGGVTDTLLESELFGHAKGSFTGAYRDKPGKLEMAAGGTLFLDEVGEMGPRMQAALLRFLETGEIQRVGCDRALTRVEVRVIAATNRNLLERVAAKEFREDLYYRLNVIHIQVPALRDHLEDVPALVDHFLDMFSQLHRVPRPELSLETLARLQRHDWPGNVRELKNVIERLVVRWETRGTASHLPFELTNRPPAAPAPPPVTRAAALHTRMVTTRETFWTVVHEPFMSHDLTRADLQELLRIGLEDTRGSYKILAGLYNITPDGYRRFMGFLRKHGCHVPFQAFRKAPAKTALDVTRLSSSAEPVDITRSA